jgi:ecotin
MRTIGSIALLAFVSISIALAADDLKAFPPAEEGMTRHVIRLPKQKDETTLKVELIIGKTVKTDAQNRHFFGGTLATENIPGWGYDRYMQVERFISIGGETILHYNSRLPVVVYVPLDVEVRYRIWRAEPILLSAPEERR